MFLSSDLTDEDAVALRNIYYDHTQITYFAVKQWSSLCDHRIDMPLLTPTL